MKVLDLQCSLSHSFEGWFGSEDDFQQQLARGLVECPLCGDTAVTKMLSAPRLNLGAPEPRASSDVQQGKPTGQGPDTQGRNDVMNAPDAAMQAAWLKMVRHVMANTDDVGDRFADEARRIHYGESQERGIRGQATVKETEALLEEGIGVLPLPIPKVLKGPIH